MTSIATFEYDGLNRRIEKIDTASNPDIVYDYYHNEQWQVIEERKNSDSDPLAQYVWHPYYIDALAVRYYDEDTDNNLSENNDGKHYYFQDANFNVTAVVNDSGTVLERYSYTPHGDVTVLDASFAADSDGVCDIGNNYLFTGRELDSETGLQINRNRYLHLQLGRWVNRDPIEYLAGMNLYQHVSGIPVDNADPAGLAKGLWNTLCEAGRGCWSVGPIDA